MSLIEVDRSGRADREWVIEAIRKLKADQNRSADTHLIAVEMPAFPGIDLYLKDESTHPTGSLKHRLARSLFLYGLCSGLIFEGTEIVEASSGSTAVSEAFFARMLGLPFTAVMATGTSPSKIALIEREAGTCVLVDDPASVCDVARDIAVKTKGHYLDQFTFAERATDWRGNNNIAESIFGQLEMERFPEPAWVIVGAGTGGTSATIGRFVRYRGLATRVCVVDPEDSAFLAIFQDPDCGEVTCGSKIEGIGRPQNVASFLPAVVDRLVRVPDAASVAAAHFLRQRTGALAGPSTGTALYAAAKLACDMHAAGQTGSIVTLLCDNGVRYLDTYFSDAWVREQGWDIEPYLDVMNRAWDDGVWTG